jgi:hypothetical protein
MAAAHIMNVQEDPMPSRAETHSYLLRIWRDSVDTPWRASIVHIMTGEVVKFGDAHEIYAHLKRQMEQPSAE